MRGERLSVLTSGELGQWQQRKGAFGDGRRSWRDALAARKVRATVASAIQDSRANGCHAGVVTPDPCVSGLKDCGLGTVGGARQKDMHGSRAADGD